MQKMENEKKPHQVKKQQKMSKSYLVRSFGENIGKIGTLKLLEGEELTQLQELHKKVVANYMKSEFKLNV